MSKRQLRAAARYGLAIVAMTTAVVLVRAWRQQSSAVLSCRAAFGQLEAHNGYVQVDLVRQHPTEQYFDAEVFVLYAESESPPEQLRLTRGAIGNYAASIGEVTLVPFGDGKATPKPLAFGLPTPDVSQRLFPFDSPNFDIAFKFEPPKRPKVVIVRNRTPDFIPLCDTLRTEWTNANTLTLQMGFRRNPFVQTTIIIVGFAALAFGVLLGQIRNPETLATATASYFFSLWSIRGIVAPPAVVFPTLLDFWLMAVSVVVLLLVAWRLLAQNGQRRKTQA